MELLNWQAFGQLQVTVTALLDNFQFVQFYKYWENHRDQGVVLPSPDVTNLCNQDREFEIDKCKRKICTPKWRNIPVFPDRGHPWESGNLCYRNWSCSLQSSAGRCTLSSSVWTRWFHTLLLRTEDGSRTPLQDFRWNGRWLYKDGQMTKYLPGYFTTQHSNWQSQTCPRFTSISPQTAKS